jgi:hypothetical protein
MGTYCSLTVVDPFNDLLWRKDCHAIEASAGLTLFQFGAISPAMVMRENVVVVLAAESRKDVHLTSPATPTIFRRAPTGREGFVLLLSRGFTLGYYHGLPPGGKSFNL